MRDRDTRAAEPMGGSGVVGEVESVGAVTDGCMLGLLSNRCCIEKILKWVETVATDSFTDAARECLLEWVRARSRNTENWARYTFNSCRSFDYETTSPAEGAHSGLKMSNEVRL